jgi:ribosomal protein S18 acetylase RimI-like enzyme
VVDVRCAVPDDAPELVRLQQVMLVAVDGLDPTREDWQPSAVRALRTRLTDADGSFVAFVIDALDAPGRLAACAVGLVERRLVGPHNPTGELGYIMNVVTDPGCRRRGYARACMQELLAWYRHRGIVRIDLRASPEGEPLYQALGFTRPPLPTLQLSFPPTGDVEAGTAKTGCTPTTITVVVTRPS